MASTCSRLLSGGPGGTSAFVLRRMRTSAAAVPRPSPRRAVALSRRAGRQQQTPSAQCGSVLPTSRSASTGLRTSRTDRIRCRNSSDSNAQLEIVLESEEAVVVWKRPGVSVRDEGEAVPKKGASMGRAEPPIEILAQKNWGSQAATISDLEKSAAGLVLVARTPAALETISKSSAAISSGFTAVVLESANEDHYEVDIVEKSLQGSTSAWEACNSLAADGNPVVGRTGTSEIPGVRGAHVALTALQHLPESLRLGPSVIHEAPKKFMKLKRRLDIRNQRSSETHEEPKETQAEFCTLNFWTSAPQLLPRKSSEAVVQAVVKAASAMLSGSPQQSPLRILDLGTGCGCLLLSVLNQLKGSVESGTGLDVSQQAIDFAQRNATELAAAGLIDSEANFFLGSFSELHDLRSVEELGGTPYNLIVSNPPYLASARSSGRVTSEGDDALVAGQTGMESYVSIAKSISQCDPPLLTDSGRLVFQAPGGERAHIRLTAAVKPFGFALEEIQNDSRGVKRALVFSLSPSASPDASPSSPEA